MSNKYKKNQKTFLEILVVAIFKAIWWLVKLPFSSKRAAIGLSTTARNRLTEKRLQIEEMLSSDNQFEIKHALFEADKLVDEAMKQMGFSGETFADRLRFGENQIDPNTYQLIWQGHKVRNQLAHESDFEIDNNEIKRATINLLRFLKNV